MTKSTLTHIVSIAIVLFLLAELTYFFVPIGYARALLIAIVGTLIFYIPQIKNHSKIKPLLAGTVILITTIITAFLFSDNVIAPQTVWSFIVHAIVLVIAYFSVRKYF